MLGENLNLGDLRKNLKEHIEISSEGFTKDVLMKKDFLKRYTDNGYFAETKILAELKIPNYQLNEWCYRDKKFNVLYFYVKEHLINLYAVYALTSKSTMRYNYLTLVEAIFNNQRAFHFSKLYHSYMGTRVWKDEENKEEVEKVKDANPVNIVE